MPRRLDTAIGWARLGDRARAVEAADTHVITRARHEPEFRAALRNFDLICPDGMPLVWAINGEVEASRRLTERVSGAELMGEIFRQSASDPTLKHFLLGGSEKLLETLQTKLGETFPGAAIADVYSPPFGPWPEDEFQRICDRIRASGANFVWVGLGCPKQERWIGENLTQLPPAVYFGIGAAFAFHAGTVERAPALFQKLGLEWAYRVYREPKRLFRRYFTYNSLFLWYSLRDRMLAD
ncbi:MAG: WecB/TagA/CpsF family glycosyltransferase [Luteolibacter sp.]